MSGFLSGGGGIAAGLIVTCPNGVQAGFLECDGSLLSRATYAVLFSVIGEKYGAGDGSSTFQIPDLRGEFIRGFDNGRGVDSGRAEGSTQSEQYKSHKHAATVTDSYSGAGLVGDAFVAWSEGMAAKVSSLSTTRNVSMSNSGGNETRPRNVAMTFCIKY